MTKERWDEIVKKNTEWSRDGIWKNEVSDAAQMIVEIIEEFEAVMSRYEGYEEVPCNSIRCSQGKGGFFGDVCPICNGHGKHLRKREVKK